MKSDSTRIKEVVTDRVETDGIFPVILGLAVALGGAPLAELFAGVLFDETGLTALVIRDLLVKWLLAGFVIGIVVFVERRSVSSIGVGKVGWKDVGGAVLVFLVGAVSYPFTTPLIESLGLETTVGGIEQLATLPLVLVVALAVTAAVTEEVLYRSYPIERIGELTGSPAVGAGLTFALFFLFHIPFWGLGGTLQISVNAILVTLLYLWRRNLFACILSHAITDIYAFVIIPRYLMQYVG
jgi:membrane protease YdiL (CAAX protease family)